MADGLFRGRNTCRVGMYIWTELAVVDCGETWMPWLALSMDWRMIHGRGVEVRA